MSCCPVANTNAAPGARAANGCQHNPTRQLSQAPHGVCNKQGCWQGWHKLPSTRCPSHVKPNADFVRSSTRRRAASRRASASASAGSTGFLLLLALAAASSRLRCTHTHTHNMKPHEGSREGASARTQHQNDHASRCVFLTTTRQFGTLG